MVKKALAQFPFLYLLLAVYSETPMPCLIWFGRPTPF